MKKKTLIVFSSIALLIIIFGVFSYRSTPPYNYQAKLFFLLNDDKLKSLYLQFEKDNDLERVSIIAGKKITGMKIGNDTDQELEKDRGEIYRKLLLEAKASPVKRLNDGVLFYIGGQYKFGKNFNIAYIKRNNSSSGVASCDGQYKTKQHGSCDIALNDNWVINYQWVGTSLGAVN